MTAPRRRWFRFSLRTMLVGVTALALWLGWNVTIAHRRLAELDRIKQRGGTAVTATEAAAYAPGSLELTASRFRVPFLRACFGDRGISAITLPEAQFNAHEFTRVQRIFPEASVARPIPPGTFPKDY